MKEVTDKEKKNSRRIQSHLPIRRRASAGPTPKRTQKLLCPPRRPGMAEPNRYRRRSRIWLLFPFTPFPRLQANTNHTDATIEWTTALPWLRSITTLEIWLKGIATPEDVALAIQHNVDGIMISNHGGRQLDGVPATLDSLRDCAGVAKGKIPIAFDGGVRRGSDVFKALALGADFVFMGRVPIWGLAVSSFCSSSFVASFSGLVWIGFVGFWGRWRWLRVREVGIVANFDLQYKGQEGVELAVKILMAELKMTMALAGYVLQSTRCVFTMTAMLTTFRRCRTVKEINRGHLAVLKGDGVLCKL